MFHLALVVPVSEKSASITHKRWCFVEWTPNWCWIGHLGMLRMSHKLAFRPRNATLQQTHLRRDATPSSDSTKLGARGKKCFLIRKIFSYCKRHTYLQMFYLQDVITARRLMHWPMRWKLEVRGFQSLSQDFLPAKYLLKYTCMAIVWWNTCIICLFLRIN